MPVAKGFIQVEGIDYEEMFSPVVKFQSIRTLAALVACCDLELHQIDVKTAFLNGKLEEKIYKKQPKGFVVQGHEDKVYRLHRALYGLKQASKQWYRKLRRAIDEIGFVPNNANTCFYIKHSGSSYLYLSLYVDDILIVGDKLEAIN